MKATTISCNLTLGVCPLTLPARAREPWTFPPSRGTVRSTVRFSRAARLTSSSRGEPEQNRFSWIWSEWEDTPGYELQGTHLLTVDTLEHGELGPELSDIGLGGDLQNMGLASVHDQLHGDTISTSGICTSTTFMLDIQMQICSALEDARMLKSNQQNSQTMKMNSQLVNHFQRNNRK